MVLKKSKNIFKKTLTSHVAKKGQKYTVEKILTKSLKQIQKQQKKNATNIIKTSLLNFIPAFRMIQLTNKQRRKKSIKQIPAFLSNNKSRSSWGLKNLTNFSPQETSKTNLLYKLNNQFLLTTTKIENNQQNELSNKKKYFKYYRW
uniref:ribosomal protein S7 n=1 Tax=Navicula tsukamotoi TaxID=2018706 RepID=UPI002027B772|nr:ribosomal protein S7 [Navicula tsukamotoi]QYB23094.1 ribosomal protein S7 [Navicula tsukamotoi]